MWTRFYDMHSGGKSKLKPYEKIYIELPKNEAVEFFEDKFGRDPYDIACSCCGPDYSIDEKEDLAQITAFHRNCIFDKTLSKYLEAGCTYGAKKLISLEDYEKQEDVLIIHQKDLSAYSGINHLKEWQKKARRFH